MENRVPRLRVNNMSFDVGRLMMREQLLRFKVEERVITGECPVCGVITISAPDALALSACSASGEAAPQKAAGGDLSDVRSVLLG